MIDQWFAFIVSGIGGVVCMAVANRLFKLITIQINERSPKDKRVSPIAFYPWTGPEILGRHKEYFPSSSLRLAFYLVSAGMMLFLLASFFFSPDPRA
jgi:hypothetical protein